MHYFHMAPAVTAQRGRSINSDHPVVMPDIDIWPLVINTVLCILCDGRVLLLAKYVQPAWLLVIACRVLDYS